MPGTSNINSILSVLLLSFMLASVGSCGMFDDETFASHAPFLHEKNEAVDSILAEMSLPEKIGQLIFLELDLTKPDAEATLYREVAAGRVGALLLKGTDLNGFLRIQDSINVLTSIAPLMLTREGRYVQQQFEGQRKMPGLAALTAAGDIAAEENLKQYFTGLSELGIRFWLDDGNTHDLPVDRWLEARAFPQKLKDYNDHRTLSATTLTLKYVPENDPASLDSLALVRDRELALKGLSGIMLDSSWLDQAERSVAGNDSWRRFLRKQIAFDGLIIAESNADNSSDHLKSGADVLYLQSDSRKSFERVLLESENSGLDNIDLDERVRKVLLAKSWTGNGLPDQGKIELKQEPQHSTLQATMISIGKNNDENSTQDDEVESIFETRAWVFKENELVEASGTLASNASRIVPINDLKSANISVVGYGQEPFFEFEEMLEKYIDIEKVHVNTPKGKGMDALSERSGLDIVLLDDHVLDPEKDAAFISSLRVQGAKGKVILVNFSRPENLSHFDSSLAVIQFYGRNKVSERAAAQIIVGAMPAQGRLPVWISEQFPQGKSVHITPRRLKYGLPEEVGIAPERLVGITAIAKTAVEDGDIPGAQILVAKNGKIIYNESFGYHGSNHKNAVKPTDLYDVASITKVAATTLTAMKLYEDGKYKLKDRVREFLPSPSGSTIKNISIQKLLTHGSGIQPYMPVLDYLRYRDKPNAGCDSYFCKQRTGTYGIQVADNFFFKSSYLPTIQKELHEMEVQPRRNYRYSDANFVLVQMIMEKLGGMPLDSYVDLNFFQPLGLRRSFFKPLEHLSKSEIVPTQKDDRWRHQTVQGYVHDETAALLGGVAGHAGLFSTAEELAVIFQMLLNGGTYGGHTFLDPETIELFTSNGHGNHRGLGFDKPDNDKHNSSSLSPQASEATFGHTGFTGTAVWADPDTDLIYIFLSNRINPDINNQGLNKKKIRRRIHQVIYDALDTYQPPNTNHLLQ